jgi:hypothetical protein
MLHNFDTPKQCIQAQNTSFASLYLSKVIEMLRNTPKHHLAQMEWNGCFTTLTPRNSVFRPETQVLHLCTCRRLSKYSETLPNIILAQMEWNGCFTTFTPRNSVFKPETQVLLLCTCRRLSKCSETIPNIILAQMEWNGCFTTATPRNSVFRLGTQV